MFITKEVIEPIASNEIVEIYRRKYPVIPLIWQDIDKFENAVYTKSKSRWCMMGTEKMDPEKVLIDGYVPTCRMTTLYVFCNMLASNPKLEAVVMDVKEAYLNSLMTRLVYAKVSPKDTKMWIGECAKQGSTMPENCIQPDGSMIARVVKCVYGLVDSGPNWFKDFSSSIETWKYAKAKTDAAAFIHEEVKNESVAAMAIHVDDVIALGEKDRKEILIKQFTEKYPGSRVQRLEKGSKVNFLSITIEQRLDSSVFIHQRAYAEQVVEMFGLEPDETASEPHFRDLNDARTDAKYPDVTRFRSLLMSVAQLTKTRPDLATGVNALSIRQACPTLRDMEQLIQIAKYVNGTLDVGLHYVKSDMQVMGASDASYFQFPDGKGQSGVMIWLGKSNAPIIWLGKKQNLITRCTAESEMVAMCLAAEQLLWVRWLLTELRYTQTTTLLQNDNKSAIMLEQQGPGTHGRGRFVQVKFFFVHDLIKDKTVSVEYVASEDLIADGLTKGLVGRMFKRWFDAIYNRVGKEEIKSK